MKGRGVSKTLCAVLKKRQLAFDYFNRILKIFFDNYFNVMEDHKVDFLCPKKRVCFYWECLLISCVF